ncbi:MAG: glycine/sarcosine/betaine reductase selenoprotein B family protein [Nitrospinales bacterium]
MKKINRLKNKGIARLASSFPVIAKYLIASYTPLEFEDIPWAPIKKPLNQSKIALVTTAGIHHAGQKPFDMGDPEGDPSYRIIDANKIEKDFLITHDYYDHRNADKDLNIIFPITRLRELADAGIIGSIARNHFGFMGHITDSHLQNLIEKMAPEVATSLLKEHVDAVLMTPG